MKDRTNIKYRTDRQICPRFIRGRSLRTHKVCDGPGSPVLVLLQEAHQEGADSGGLPRRQLQRLVEDPVIHLPDVTAVEGRLRGGEGRILLCHRMKLWHGK